MYFFIDISMYNDKSWTQINDLKKKTCSSLKQFAMLARKIKEYVELPWYESLIGLRWQFQFAVTRPESNPRLRSATLP